MMHELDEIILGLGWMQGAVTTERLDLMEEAIKLKMADDPRCSYQNDEQLRCAEAAVPLSHEHKF